MITVNLHISHSLIQSAYPLTN